MNETLRTTFRSLESAANTISEERKQVLQPLVEYIIGQQKANDPTRLNFICTHNSRRSHMAQLLAAAAARFADLDNIDCYSGGTEETRIHPNALRALEELGFSFAGEEGGDNPHFLVNLGDAVMLEIFSKKYDSETNPRRDFAAVMVCSAAEEACPFVEGAEKRVSVTFEDPKEFDHDEDPIPGYVKRAKEIGAEMLYTMQRVSEKIDG